MERFTAALILATALWLGSTTGSAEAQAAAGAASSNQSPIALLDLGTAGGGASNRLELLSLKRIFTTIGTPVDVIQDSDRLPDYKVVFTAGELTNPNVTQQLANSLFDYVEGGGVLVSAGEIGNLVYPLFGVTAQVPSQKRYRLTFLTSDPITSFIDHPNEKTISLGNGEQHFFAA